MHCILIDPILYAIRYESFLPPGLFNPGFFNGAADVGYQLLRQVYSDDLPNLLLFK
jgi:lantibiotic modifying enzyme